MVLTDLHSSKKESEMVLRKRNEDLKEDIARLLAEEKERDAQWERAYATIDADARAAAALLLRRREPAHQHESAGRLLVRAAAPVRVRPAATARANGRAEGRAVKNAVLEF